MFPFGEGVGVGVKGVVFPSSTRRYKGWGRLGESGVYGKNIFYKTLQGKIRGLYFKYLV